MQSSSQMQCAKFVAQLHNLPDSEGQITSFTSTGNIVYLGTTLGNVQAYRITVKPSAEKQIFTTLTFKTTLIEKKKVSKLIHSPGRSLLFALCGKKIHLIDSRTLQVRRVITTGVSDFWVSEGIDPLSGYRSQHLHEITCAMHDKKEVLVVEYDAQSDSTEVIHTLILPEPVQQVVEYNGLVCLAMRREYSLLSVFDGDSKSLLALTGNTVPMLSLGGSDVFMRLGEAVFVVSMKHMPTSGNALKSTIRFPEEPKALVYCHPFLFGFGKSYCNVYSWYDSDIIEELPIEDCIFASPNVAQNTIFCASKNKFWLIRTVSIEHQLEQLVTKGKLDQAFDLLRAHPEIHRHEFLDDEAIGTQLVSDAAAKNSYQPQTDSAGNDSEGMAAVTNLSGAIEERSSPRSDGSLSISARHLEANLNVMVAFANLYNNNPTESIGHFGSHVDVREPLLHLPDMLPNRRSMDWVIGWLKFYHPQLRKGPSRPGPGWDWYVGQGADAERLALLKLTCHADDEDSDAEKYFWEGFRPRHPHSKLWGLYYEDTSEVNTPTSPDPSPSPKVAQPSAADVRDVLTCAWASVYYKQGDASTTTGDQRRLFDAATLLASGPYTSSFHGLVSLTLSEYLQLAEDRLKEELVKWLSSRLQTAQPSQRRAAEFALFTLYSQSSDRRSLYMLASACEFTKLADVWELLSSPTLRLTDSKGGIQPAEDLIVQPFSASSEHPQQLSSSHHDVLSRCLGMDVSSGEWRLLHVLLSRQLGLRPYTTTGAFADPDSMVQLPTQSPELRYFFHRYMSIKGPSQHTYNCLSEGRFRSYFSNNDGSVTQLNDPSMLLSKGRQWPLLLRDYVEACRVMFAIKDFKSPFPEYPASMYTPREALTADSRAPKASHWTVRRQTGHELFYAVESGDYRYVAEALQKQQSEHRAMLSLNTFAPFSGRSIWLTTDDEGNNAFHLVFLMLLRANANASFASRTSIDSDDDEQTSVAASTTDPPTVTTQQLTAGRRARLLAAQSANGTSQGSIISHVEQQDWLADQVAKVYEGQEQVLSSVSHTISADAALALVATLLNFGCSEITVDVNVAAQAARPMEPAGDAPDDGILGAFKESLGCALANPSSLLLLTMPNDFGITPLQLIEALPTSQATGETGSRFTTDPNSHVLDLIISFILAQLRVFTVPG